MGTRQRSRLPIKDSKKRLQEPSNKKILNGKVFQDLDALSSGTNKLDNQSNTVSHLQNPLTPLHRLKRFKEIRDKNLRKSTLEGKRKLKMSVDVEKEGTAERSNTKEIKSSKGKREKMRNGTQENGDKNDGNSEMKGEKERISSGEENLETNGSQNKEITEKTEEKEVEKQEIVKTQEEVSIKEVEKQEIIKTQKEESIKEVEKQEIIKTQEEESTENVLDNKDNNECNVGNEVVDEEEEEIDVEVLRTESDRDEQGETDYESSLEDEQREKVLRRRFMLDVSKSKPSTSKMDSNFFEQPKEKQSSLSPETTRRLKSARIEGRRSLWQNKGLHRKRKLDDFSVDGYTTNYEKKQAIRNEETMNSSSSVLSPGWKFISSPFARFWTPLNSSKPGYTPYKSLTTPYPLDDFEDSLAVNVDDKSLYSKLNDSDLDITIDSSHATNSNWRCNIM